MINTDFDYDSRSHTDLTLAELQVAYSRLMIEYSKQTLNLRAIKIENQQIKLLMTGERITTKGLATIRENLLRNYLLSLKPLKPKRGRPKQFEQQMRVAELWRLYEQDDNQSGGVKTWLRSQLENHYYSQGHSLTVMKKTIESEVQKIATQMSRHKTPKRYKNKF